jgi:phospholipid/cholesterol/gamma-HCH transport system substrate-binding protein
MESRASYLLVGIFVLTMLIGGAGLVAWLARYEFKDARLYYYIYFKGSVTGLSEGSQVRLRGVSVGTVTNIEIDTKNIEVIEVTIGVRPGTPIKTNTVASIAAQGITGLSYIALTGGTNDAPLLEPRAGKRRATIPSTTSALERLVDEAPNLLANANVVAERAAALLSEENLTKIAGIVANLHAVIETLSSRREQLGDMFEDWRKTATAARSAAESVDDLVREIDKMLGRLEKLATETVGRLEREATATFAETRGFVRDADKVVISAGPAIADFRATVQSYQRVSRELELFMRDLRPGTRDFAGRGLAEVGQFVTEARALVASMQRLTVLMERDPARFFFGDQTRGFEPRR